MPKIKMPKPGKDLALPRPLPKDLALPCPLPIVKELTHLAVAVRMARTQMAAAAVKGDVLALGYWDAIKQVPPDVQRMLFDGETATQWRRGVTRALSKFNKKYGCA